MSDIDALMRMKIIKKKKVIPLSKDTQQNRSRIRIFIYIRILYRKHSNLFIFYQPL